MSRYANTQNIAAAVCDSTLNKEQGLREKVRENAQLCETAASRLAKGGEPDEILMSMVEYIDDESILSKDQVATFFQDQRDRLKQVARMNVENSRSLDVFFNAIHTLKQVEVAEFDAERNDEDAGDPGERLQHFYEQKKREQEETKLEMSQEKIFRDVCEKMGEKVGGGVEDDEIEMVHNTNSQRSVLICPLTTALMENPVKNRVCKHTYSKAAIEEHIRSAQRKHRTCKCPVSGCSNTNVTLDQLEHDLVTANLVKREKRRLEHEKVARLTQADDVDSDEE